LKTVLKQSVARIRSIIIILIIIIIEAAYKTEKINIAEYLNKRYKEDQFVNIIKSHDSIQPHMNSTVKAAAKIIDE
jgi:hypothetical protein